MKQSELADGCLYKVSQGLYSIVVKYDSKEKTFNDKYTLDFLLGNVYARDAANDGAMYAVSPIEITDEILEENSDGRYSDGTYIFIGNNCIEVEVKYINYGYAINGITIWYVHELQKELRNLGLCDTADNFNIEHI